MIFVFLILNLVIYPTYGPMDPLERDLNHAQEYNIILFADYLAMAISSTFRIIFKLSALNSKALVVTSKG